jgi:eukaryotic-like serine/threonine-protein kinase
MRTFGVIAMALGAVLVVVDLALRALATSLAGVWVVGVLFLSAGAAVLLRSRADSSGMLKVASRPDKAPGLETSRLLDNFEQRFAELKKRNPNAAVLNELYELGSQLEERNRRSHATVVFRHLARIDGGFRDVAARLKKLVDAEAAVAPPTPAAAPVRSKPAGVPPPAKTPASAEGATGTLQSLGRYRLEREIGRGAMGTVYLGRDSAINRLVAIKAIPLAREFSDTELAEARARFFREAETAGRLNHPNIVTIYDVGEQDGLAYIAMEYLKGKHLSDFAGPNTLLEPRKVVELVGRTADALGFAHKQGVVHRDIKPANLMYDLAGDTLKITDFGIARLTDSGSTRTGIVLGTPSFMSPEQLEGRSVTGHSDLFSLGVTLFQLLTGQLPFRADTMTGLMQQIAESPHPPIKAIRPDLPDCVQKVIDRALAKSPEDRFESGAQMAAALDDCKARIPSGLP